MAIESGGAETVDSTLTAVVSGSTNVKGSYVEMIASTARENYVLKIRCKRASIRENFKGYVAVGAAASEVDIFEFSFWSGSEHGDVKEGLVPITIASGSRVSIAVQATQSTVSLDLGIELSDEDSFGTSTENSLVGINGSRGTDIDPGGTINTKGAYSEIESSTSIDANYIIIMPGGSDNSSMSSCNVLMDFALGVSSSEVIFIENAYVAMSSDEIVATWMSQYIDIPSGSRISARCQSSINDATDRIIDVAILLVNIIAPSGGGGVSQALAY